MKKIKMFGFAFLLMFACAFNVSAVELGQMTDDGKVSYTKEADETFSYQIVKITTAELDSIKNDVTALLTKMERDTTALEDASAAYEADPTNADLEAAADEALETLKQDMADLNAKVASVGNYTASWTEVSDTATSGSIQIPDAINADDAYIIWLKSDEFVDLVTDGIMIGEIYTQDSSIDVPTDVPSDNTTDTTKKPEVQKTSNVKNPKTGINLPIVGGIAVIILAGAGVYLIRRNNLFKQI